MSPTPFEQETVAEMVQILGRGAVYGTITERVKALEKQYSRNGAVIRLSFDLPVLKWGAYVSLLVVRENRGAVFCKNVYGSPTAAKAVEAVENALQNEFWKTAPEEKRCQKCGGTGIECYDDPEDNDVHLRPCDCSTGRAKKHEMESEARKTP